MTKAKKPFRCNHPILVLHILPQDENTTPSSLRAECRAEFILQVYNEIVYVLALVCIEEKQNRVDQGCLHPTTDEKSIQENEHRESESRSIGRNIRVVGSKTEHIQEKNLIVTSVRPRAIEALLKKKKKSFYSNTTNGSDDHKL